MKSKRILKESVANKNVAKISCGDITNHKNRFEFSIISYPMNTEKEHAQKVGSTTDYCIKDKKY